jgi:hypothetical protein
MAKLALCEWEINGYHDSDWMVATFDTETSEFGSRLVNSTRFGGGFEYEDLVKPDQADPAHILLAFECLQAKFFDQLRAEEFRRINNPQPSELKAGMGMVLAKACKHRAMVKCEKCDGSGEWVNPKRDGDIRACFGCHGTGHTPGGKSAPWVKLEAGKRMVLKDWKSWGQFYRNGYNQPHGGNTTCMLVSEYGGHKVKLDNLALDIEPLSDHDMMVRAHRKACTGRFDLVSGAKTTWLDWSVKPPEAFKNKLTPSL